MIKFKSKKMKSISIILIAISFLACSQKEKNTILVENTATIAKTFEDKLAAAAISIVDPTIDYDPSYFSIKYPNGDIPKKKGFVPM